MQKEVTKSKMNNKEERIKSFSYFGDCKLHLHHDFGDRFSKCMSHSSENCAFVSVSNTAIYSRTLILYHFRCIFFSICILDVLFFSLLLVFIHLFCCSVGVYSLQFRRIEKTTNANVNAFLFTLWHCKMTRIICTSLVWREQSFNNISSSKNKSAKRMSILLIVKYTEFYGIVIWFLLKKFLRYKEKKRLGVFIWIFPMHRSISLCVSPKYLIIRRLFGFCFVAISSSTT